MKGMMMKYILASGSPRRKELLAKVIPEFEIIPAVSEEVCSSTEPSDVVAELSFQKASEIFYKVFTDKGGRFVVIGSDTVVSYNHRVLGKPTDRDDAINMVNMLQGQTHSVYTGVTVFYNEGEEVRNFTFSECTLVHVEAMSDAEVKEYVASGECDDKAGAYGIQGLFARYIRGIDGDYYNVMGLPVARLYKELKEHQLI
jgi:septum formation protein